MERPKPYDEYQSLKNIVIDDDLSVYSPHND